MSDEYWDKVSNWQPENLREYDRHGTGVASVALGERYGVANRANLVMIKMSNGVRTGARQIEQEITYEGFSAATKIFWEEYEARKTEEDNKGFVVNISFGKTSYEGRMA